MTVDTAEPVVATVLFYETTLTDDLDSDLECDRKADRLIERPLLLSSSITPCSTDTLIILSGRLWSNCNVNVDGKGKGKSARFGKVKVK